MSRRQNKRVNSSLPHPAKRRDRLRGWSLLAGAGLLLLWIGENFVGEKTGLTALLAYVPQHGWGALPAVCGALALPKRRFGWALFNGALLVFWAMALLGLRWHPAFLAPRSARSVRVVTYNVAGRDTLAPEFALEIAAQHPDIICLQEARRTYPPERAGENNVGQAIARHFPGWHLESAGDVCILSRFPIESSRSFPLRLGRRTLEARLATPYGPLRVLTTHISTAFHGQARYAGLTAQLREVVPNARQAAGARLEQIGPLDAALAADPNTPLVLCGDFNTPPCGLFYRHLRGRLDDGFARAGNGLGLSFPSGFPLLRIDYVWTRGAQAQRVRVAPIGASDHRMVVADVGF